MIDYSSLDDLSEEEVAFFKEDAQDNIDAMAFSVASTVVAEGDSWFDYPVGTDLIDCLRRHHGYQITKNYAKHGDTLENMIYGTGVNRSYRRTTPQIDKILRRVEKLQPQVFLFSGGGNDIAGNEFISFLNHSESGFPSLKEDFARKTIRVVFSKYYDDLIGKVHAVSANTHIIAHGYGHTLPTGVGVDLFGFSFSGPWLKPALGAKRIDPDTQGRQIITWLIDEYNAMLSELSERHDRFHHVDLRQHIDPERDWVNELHLRNSAYARSADEIHKVIQTL